jgi:hypothetical protein
MRTLIAVGTLLALLHTPAAAFFDRPQNAPWCVDYVYLENAVDCAFYDYRQCIETASGVGGYCFENRWISIAERKRRPEWRPHGAR